ncbi:MAG: MmgE/PrpD family protein [Alphaproteobacteria bacterium]|nr:MmgE/PrpD family protein [Alphaproteobacteria bacterium]
MTEVQELAQFVVTRDINDLSKEVIEQLKIRILDSLGCAIGALKGEPICLIRDHIDEFGGNPIACLIGGGKTAPDRAAFYNGALVRYLDFMDSYLAKGETCHPSDNLAPLLAAADYAHVGGKELLTALAMAYQIQCRLCDEAPVRAKGFDHTTQGAYAIAAGVSKVLRLDQEKTANAIAISGTSNIALRVARTGSLSHWKGLAYPNTAYIATHAAFLARRGITGPLEVFEGNKGFKETISGPFTIDWPKEDLERVNRTIVKKYNAEIHSQSAIEGTLELRAQHGFSGNEVEAVEIDIFDVAYHIIGGGEEGDKKSVRTKEEADHSLPYMVAVALLDGELLPQQYAPQRIKKDDVQNLLQRVTVRENPSLSARFPSELPCNVKIQLKDGQTFRIEKKDYEGFFTRPFSWEDITKKFHQLAEPFASKEIRNKIVQIVHHIETVKIEDLTNLFSQINQEKKS